MTRMAAKGTSFSSEAGFSFVTETPPVVELATAVCELPLCCAARNGLTCGCVRA